MSLSVSATWEGTRVSYLHSTYHTWYCYLAFAQSQAETVSMSIISLNLHNKTHKVDNVRNNLKENMRMKLGSLSNTTADERLTSLPAMKSGAPAHAAALADGPFRTDAFPLDALSASCLIQGDAAPPLSPFQHTPLHLAGTRRIIFYLKYLEQRKHTPANNV